MITISIYHQVGDNRFRPFDPLLSELELAYSYEREEDDPIEYDLETVYRENNAVDGSEENVKAEHRSLSVGDVVVVAKSPARFEGADFTVATVDMIGFRTIKQGELERALENRQSGNPVRVAKVTGNAGFGGDELGEAIAPYLPANYRVARTNEDGSVTIKGRDRFGWTLDEYVIPRLASGLYFAEEVTS